jgi:hypothetical protein
MSTRLGPRRPTSPRFSLYTFRVLPPCPLRASPFQIKFPRLLLLSSSKYVSPCRQYDSDTAENRSDCNIRTLNETALDIANGRGHGLHSDNTQKGHTPNSQTCSYTACSAIVRSDCKSADSLEGASSRKLSRSEPHAQRSCNDKLERTQQQQDNQTLEGKHTGGQGKHEEEDKGARMLRHIRHCCHSLHAAVPASNPPSGRSL